MPQFVRYHDDEGYQALYVDGKLEIFNEPYLVDQAIAAHLGVQEITDEDFIVDNEALETLEEVEKLSLANMRVRAQALRDHAANLQREALEIERSLEDS